MSSDKFEIILTLKILFNEKCFTDSATSAYYDKFRFIGLHTLVEYVTLLLPGYQFVLHVFDFFAKVTVYWEMLKFIARKITLV